MDHKFFGPECLFLNSFYKYPLCQIRRYLDRRPTLQRYLSNNHAWDGKICSTWLKETAPLHRAAFDGLLPVAKILICEYKVVVNATQYYANERNCVTPLQCAIWGDKPAMVQFLLEHGARLTEGGRWKGRDMPDALALARAMGDRVEIIEILEEAQARVMKVEGKGFLFHVHNRAKDIC